MDIVEFITARYDEAQYRAELAQECVEADGDGWEPIAHQLPACCDTVQLVGRLDQHLHHNADPARVLADIAAKRALVRDLQVEGGVSAVLDLAGAPAIGPGQKLAVGALRLLAAPYAAHPDFDPEWAVD